MSKQGHLIRWPKNDDADRAEGIMRLALRFYNSMLPVDVPDVKCGRFHQLLCLGDIPAIEAHKLAMQKYNGRKR